MKFFLAIAYILTLRLFAFGVDAERMADAIYKAEGGRKARVPYGILSLKVRDAAHARQVCIRTILNNERRWIAAGRPGEYIDFLADRYCPPSVDPVGNRNWKRNIRKLYAQTHH